MENKLTNRILRAFELTNELYNSLEEQQLQLKMQILPSNTIGDQVWCIVGARESYFEAIKNSKWIGFSCSLKDPHNMTDIMLSLNSTKRDIERYLDQKELSDAQIDIAFDLLEHEIQHHGQLIRYFYANKIKFPESWNERYTV